MPVKDNPKIDRSQILILRLRSIRDLLDRSTKSGTDVHEMENIRHCASGAIEMLRDPGTAPGVLEGLVASLERRCSDLFKKRYEVPDRSSVEGDLKYRRELRGKAKVKGRRGMSRRDEDLDN